MSLYPNAPGHRNVETSMDAADTLVAKLGRLQQRVRTAIRNAGRSGLTAEELAAALQESIRAVQPRTSELRRLGLIRDSGDRRLNSTRRRAIVWVTT